MPAATFPTTSIAALRAGQERRVARVVDLRREVLEEAVELVEVPVGDGEEARGVRRAGGRPADRAQLDLQLVAEALDAPGHAHEVAAIEAPGKHIGITKRAAQIGRAHV